MQLVKKLNEFNIQTLPTQLVFQLLSLTGSLQQECTAQYSLTFFGKGDWFTTSYIGFKIDMYPFLMVLQQGRQGFQTIKA